MILNTISAVLCLVQAGQAPPATKSDASPDGAPVKREELVSAWTKSLVAICDLEQIDAMAFTIPGWEPLEVWSNPYGVPAMRLLARATRTAWFQVNGVQVFSFAHYDYANYEPLVFSLLQGLDAAAVEQLATSGMTLGELGQGPNMDLLTALVPDVAFAAVILDRGKNARVGIQFLPLVEFTDPATGKSGRLTLPGWAEDGPFQTAEVEKGASFPYVPLNRQTETGPLSFGRGSVLTLREVVAQAEEAFGTRYYLDHRLTDTLVFVRGSMGKETFAKVYEHIGAAKRPVERPNGNKLDSASLQDWLIRNADVLARSANLHGMEVSDFINGATLTAGDLVARDPGLRSLFDSRGLSPSAQIRLRAGIEFSLDPGGFRSSFPSQPGANGRTIHFGVSNRMRFVLIGQE